MSARWTVVMLALLAIPRPGAAQVVAVLPFQDAGSYSRGEAPNTGLDRTLAEGVARALSARTGAQPVPASDVSRSLAGVNLGQEGRLDAASAARVGKSLGASHVVAGTWQDHFGKVRLDARVVEVATGRVTATASAGPGDRTNLDALVQRLAAGITLGGRE